MSKKMDSQKTTSPFVYEDECAYSFTEEVIDRSGQNILACYQCRRCAAGCPVGEESGTSPDRLIRMIILGDRNQALNNGLIWQCVSCYTCGTRCPNEIQTGRITETLKKMANELNIPPLNYKVKAFHDSFCSSAVHMGRINELELMGRYEAKNTLHDLKLFNFKGLAAEAQKQTKMGIAMNRKKRMHFGIQRSKGRSEFKRWLKKTKEKTMIVRRRSGSWGLLRGLIRGI